MPRRCHRRHNQRNQLCQDSIEKKLRMVLWWAHRFAKSSETNQFLSELQLAPLCSPSFGIYWLCYTNRSAPKTTIFRLYVSSHTKLTDWADPFSACTLLGVKYEFLHTNNKKIGQLKWFFVVILCTRILPLEARVKHEKF